MVCIGIGDVAFAVFLGGRFCPPVRPDPFWNILVPLDGCVVDGVGAKAGFSGTVEGPALIPGGFGFPPETREEKPLEAPDCPGPAVCVAVAGI